MKLINIYTLQGLIEEEKLDSFNIPTYEPTMEEIRDVIREEGSFFIQESEIVMVPWDEGRKEDGDDSFDDENVRAQFIARYTRAVMEPLLSANFGAKVMNEFFIRFQKKVVQLMEVEKLEYAILVVSLTKITGRGVAQLKSLTFLLITIYFHLSVLVLVMKCNFFKKIL